MQLANAMQYDLFGQHMPLFLRAIPRKSSIEDVCNIISSKVEKETVAAQVEAVSSLPTHVFGIDVEHPSNLFEQILADRIKVSHGKPVAAISASIDDDEETLQASEAEAEEEEEGGGIIGAHKKLLKLSLKDLKHGLYATDICSWIMDGNDQARLFSFDACCRVSEIDPDSLRDNLMMAGYIPQRFLH